MTYIRFVSKAGGVHCTSYERIESDREERPFLFESIAS